jgi:hypothetical protein
VTIVHYDYRPKRARKQKPAVELPCGRIVSARKPKPRHYGEIRCGVPDEAQRTELDAETAGINLCMTDIRKQIRRQIIDDLIAEGKTGREARAIRHADRKQRREVYLCLNGKIEYDAMTDEQKRIVNAGSQIAGQFPDWLSKVELSAWIKERRL